MVMRMMGNLSPWYMCIVSVFALLLSFSAFITAQDAVEFVGMVCNGFLGNLSLVIHSCFDMFIRKPHPRLGELHL